MSRNIFPILAMIIATTQPILLKCLSHFIAQQDYIIMKNQYYVYILSSANRAIYIGVTGNLERRVYEHKNKLVKGHTSKYNITKLVYYEIGEDALAAIER